MEHMCPKCNILMVEANLDHAGLIRIYKKSSKKEKLFGVNVNEMTDIYHFVCPKCGYIELYAGEPIKFEDH